MIIVKRQETCVVSWTESVDGLNDLAELSRPLHTMFDLASRDEEHADIWH